MTRVKSLSLPEVISFSFLYTKTLSMLSKRVKRSKNTESIDQCEENLEGSSGKLQFTLKLLLEYKAEHSVLFAERL